MARINALFNKREQKYTHIDTHLCRLEATGPAQMKLSGMEINYSPYKVHQIFYEPHCIT